MSFPSFNTPARSWITPAKTTVAKIYSTPWLFANVAITTAIAPVAPDIIPGRPPKMEVIKQTINAAYNPVKGDKPAINAKATASGTKAKATVNPD